MKKYKLVTQDLKTRKGEDNETQWVIGEFHPTLDGDGDLCSLHWYHYYHDPLLAAFMNPGHADIDNPKCFVIDALGNHKDDSGVKGGCTKMRLVREVEFPVITREQRIAFAILCAKEVYKDDKWNVWADEWLSEKNRSSSAAAAYAANAATSYAAAYAASAAAYAAYASAYAAYAASAATYAASAATYAASAASWTYKKLLSIAKKALKYN